MMNITRETAAKVLEIVDQGLSRGLGDPIPGKMCVEAAVCYALGLPHSDDPGCVAPALRQFKISLNDKNWSSNEARAKGLRRLAIAQLGSAGVLDETEFVKRLALMTINKIVPRALRATGISELEKHAVACEQASSLNAADAAADAAARAAAYAADAARAARAAARAAAYAADAARAARAARAAAYAADAAADAADQELAFMAECVVQILIDMGVPGAAWLDLAPLED